ncbi:hypothetical protein Krad_1990 [Kineococcus radiotolerans SRS30216 = ATCC BAA-149]|uniref:Uncharacterized protein n=1 Tax=Kineococcus radiotolerans (strain ATCC BAA-149 / DSM 14245 / SRS30216) TaxID=266940 RepID=A6W9I7_KINRD|nr:hypothetical protein Krad_1990 [Kineococcus radiotolerans SRS30216 = ATCC BAA-149]
MHLGDHAETRVSLERTAHANWMSALRGVTVTSVHRAWKPLQGNVPEVGEPVLVGAARERFELRSPPTAAASSASPGRGDGPRTSSWVLRRPGNDRRPRRTRRGETQRKDT